MGIKRIPIIFGGERQDLNKLILGIIIGLIFGTIITVSAALVSSPPPLSDKWEDASSILLHYLREISANIHRLDVVTTNPDGSRVGKKGDMILLQTGGKHYLEINTDSSTTWHGEELSDTP